MILNYEQIQQKLSILNISPVYSNSVRYMSYGKNGGESVYTIELYFSKYSQKWDLRIIEE